MLIGYVSDEYYAALADVYLEFRGPGNRRFLTHSAPSGAIYLDIPPGEYEVCLSKPGFGSKRVKGIVNPAALAQFRLLSDRLLGYGPKYPTDFKDTHLQRV